MNPLHPRSLLSITCCLGATLFLQALFFSSSTELSHRIVHAAGPELPLRNPDFVCQSCHRDIYDRYQKTSMAQASGLAVNGLDAAELAAKDLDHSPSGVKYHVSLRGGQVYLSYSRVATPGQNELSGEDRLDYFIGSGHRGRTYLYRLEDLWFEAPINWYGKKQLWDMAPAFDRTHTMPAPLPVDANCLHCHAGEVQVSEGSVRNRYAGPPFRAAGIGCAACHGDPATHLTQMTLKAKQTVAVQKSRPLDSAILNPSKLGPSRRDSVCLQCHLEGDAAVYLPGKSLQAFRPGDDLSASVTYFVDASRVQLGGRASSQYEALLRSACKRATGDRLTCTSCHDPHSSPAPSERVNFYRTRCLTCHRGTEMVSHHPEQQDCALCHMPTRKTLDISHEQLTDHDIEARPAVPLPESPRTSARPTPELVAVGRSVASDRELGLAYAQLAQHGDRAAGERALALLQKAEIAGSKDQEVLNQLGFLLQVSGSSAAATSSYQSALRQNPFDVTASANLAVIEAASGHVEEAIRLLTRVVELDPSQTAAGLNLAFLECRAGRKGRALQVIEKMLRYNPDSTAAHQLLDRGLYGGQVCLVR